MELRLSRVCQVFVDALPDVPQHRRLALFTQLATTLDPTRHLWIILALLGGNNEVFCMHMSDADVRNIRTYLYIFTCLVRSL